MTEIHVSSHLIAHMKRSCKSQLLTPIQFDIHPSQVTIFRRVSVTLSHGSEVVSLDPHHVISMLGVT